MTLIGSLIESQMKVARVTVTFDGTAGGGEAATAVPVFTVTGEVMVVALMPYCVTLLTETGGTATVALGITGSTSLFIAATGAIGIDANEFWVDTAPDPNGVLLPAALKDVLLTDNVIMTVATADIDSGAIEFTCYYLPISLDGAVA